MRPGFLIPLMSAPVALLSAFPGLASSAGSQVLIRQAVASYPPVTMAVREITNDAGGAWWRSPNEDRRLTAMFTNELQNTGHCTVLKRAGLDKMLEGQVLAEAGITRKTRASKQGWATAVRYRGIALCGLETLVVVADRRRTPAGVLKSALPRQNGPSSAALLEAPQIASLPGRPAASCAGSSWS